MQRRGVDRRQRERHRPRHHIDQMAERELRSRTLYQGRDRAAARSFLHAIGLSAEDIDKPFIGVSNCWSETMPCNFGLRELAGPLKSGIRRAAAAGKISDAELAELEAVACPGAGACGGQYTANTMSMVMEVIGLSPVGFNSIPQMDPSKHPAAERIGPLALDVLEADRRPSKILTRRAFDNAIAAVAASGGSTNAVLHLLALAREIGVELAIDDIDRISRRTPLLCDLKPGGRFAAVELRSEEHTSEL